MTKFKANIKIKPEVIFAFFALVVLIIWITKRSKFSSCDYNSRYTTFPSGRLPMMNNSINQDYIPEYSEYSEYPEYYSGYSVFP